jgi:hypothetical protein
MVFYVGWWLYVGVVIFLSIATYGFHYASFEHPLEMTFLLPLFILLIGFGVIPMIFMVAVVTGTPALSLTYGAGAIWRHKQGIIGLMLVLSALIGLLMALNAWSRGEGSPQ